MLLLRGHVSYLVLGVLALTSATGGANSWSKNYGREANNLARKYNGRSHKDFANKAHRFFQTKYHWRNWYVLSYDPVWGWGKHTVGGADVYHKFRYYGRNFLVGSTPKSSKLDKKRASNAIHDVECSKFQLASTCRNYGARTVYRSSYNGGRAKAVINATRRCKVYFNRMADCNSIAWAVAADRNHWISKTVRITNLLFGGERYTVIVFG